MPAATNANIIQLPVSPQALASGDTGLLFEKEVVYTGTFFDADETKWDFNEADIFAWAEGIEEQLRDGLEIDLTIGHVEDQPEAVRGKVLGARASRRPDGELGLVTKLGFRDLEAAKLANTAQVSIYSPETYSSGKGKTYTRPIRHVALTQDPVLPGLGKFKPLVASLTLARKPAMIPEYLKTMAAKLGVEIADDDTAETLGAKLETATEAMSAELAKKAAPPADPETPKPTPADPTADSTKLPEEVQKAIAASFNGMAKTIACSRKAVLAGWVKDGRLSPAAAQSLSTKYVEEKAVCLSLQSGISDDFDTLAEVIDALPTKTQQHGEETGPQLTSQVLALSKATPKDTEDPLVTMAKALKA